jgi:hypothetical protein
MDGRRMDRAGRNSSKRRNRKKIFFFWRGRRKGKRGEQTQAITAFRSFLSRLCSSSSSSSSTLTPSPSPSASFLRIAANAGERNVREAFFSALLPEPCWGTPLYKQT